jgi:hypothetical protein
MLDTEMLKRILLNGSVINGGARRQGGTGGDWKRSPSGTPRGRASTQGERWEKLEQTRRLARQENSLHEGASPREAQANCTAQPEEKMKGR